MHHIKKQQDSDQLIHLIHIEDKKMQHHVKKSGRNYPILYDIYALRFRCVNGLYRMALFSRKSIEANEELTYDYNFSLFNPHEGQACKCGSGTRYQQFNESNTISQ